MKKCPLLVTLLLLFCLLALPALAQEAPSDDWLDYQVMLGGKLYTLPTPVEQLLADGWSLDKAEETLHPNQYTLSNRLTLGEQEVYVQVINLGIDELPKTQCLVGQITLDDYQAKKGATLILAGGVTLGTSQAAVEQAFGPAGDVYESSSRIALTYESDNYDEVKISFDPQTKLATSLSVRCFKTPAGYNDAALAAPSETPQAVLDYQPAQELGDDLLAFNVRVNDTIITLPAPLTFMEAQGWKLGKKLEGKIWAWDTQFGVPLVFGGYNFNTGLHNGSAKATAAANCFVTTLIFDDKAPLEVELPHGIKLGMTRESLDAALATKAYENVTITDGSTYAYYHIKSKTLQSVSLYVSKETNQVYKVEIECVP